MHLRLFLLILLLAGAGLRLYGLSHLSPPGLAHDEVAHWLINRSILAGQHAVYFTEAYGHEAGFHYLQALFGLLLGDHALALRLPAAFAGLLLVAAGFALARRLFGWQVALMAAALLAILFWPVFFSRQGLRAISLPLLSGLSAYFWWRAWLASHQKPLTRPLYDFLLAGLCAGLSFHTYMAARALPIFYALFLGYLWLFHRQALRQRWRGVLVFWLAYAVVAAPLILYLLHNPGAEYRLGEVNAPLQALQAGDPRPVLSNSLKILGMPGFYGDPLWRQNVAGWPVFDPVLAGLFYLGLALCLWRWRDGRYAFVLLWLATSALPSIVTIDAPSSIRLINSLPVLTVVPALVIHTWGKLSTDYPYLSTGVGKKRRRWLRAGVVFLLILFLGHLGRTTVALFWLWPRHSEVQFVWQAALTEVATHLDATPGLNTAAIGGWSPDTMDPPTMALSLRRNDLALSYFAPEAGTLLLPAPAGESVYIFRPAILPLDPLWEQLLRGWGASVQRSGNFVSYALPAAPVVQPDVAANAMFGSELRFLGYDEPDCEAAVCHFTTYWQVDAMPDGARRLFLHLLDNSGNLLAEDYRWDTLDPQSLWFPHWQPGDLIWQRHTLAADIEAASRLRLGIFDPYTCTPGPCKNLPTGDGAFAIDISLRGK